MNENRSENHQKALDQFVLYWGEMAGEWGINKTMAQIHALLFAENRPLDTDTIMNRLGISRGNANMNLRNLVQWGLAQKVHIKGKRRDYYTSEKDVWSTAAKIIRERQNREITPVKENLKQCIKTLEQDQGINEESEEFKKRIAEFVTFLDLFEEFTKALLPYINEKNVRHLKKLLDAVNFKHG